MLNLREYRRTADRLADHLPWAALVDDGAVLNKDGSFQRTIAFRGPDLESSTEAELVSVCARVNNVLRRFGSGWALFIEAQRRNVQTYPESRFPDAASWLVDAERRASFLAEDAQFESRYFLTFCWMPPADAAEGAGRRFFSRPDAQFARDWRAALASFVAATDRAADLLAAFMPMASPLGTSDTLTYLHGTVSERHHPVAVPDTPMYLDALLCDTPLLGGLEPRLGSSALRLLTVTGFPNMSRPAILDALNTLDFPCRWTTRFIPLDTADAVKALTRLRRQWFNKRKSLTALLREVLYSTPTQLLDSDAGNKADEVDAALQVAGGNHAGFGYLTTTFALHAPDAAIAAERLRRAERIFHDLGFTVVRETVNAVEAWLGTLPGHVYANVRQPLVHTLNLAHLMPLSAAWAGPERNAHLGGPPLLIARTEGTTPFRLSNHVGDVGHMIVVGPTGAGKSVLLALMALQFRRYPGAQVFMFDKGLSARAAVLACGGSHHALGLASDASGQPSFQPLRHVDRPDERSWAADWIHALLLQENVALTPEVKDAVWSALESLASAPIQQRTLSGLALLLAVPALRTALTPYTLAGAWGSLLDADTDTFEIADVHGFETEALMRERGAAGAVLTYLFHRLESRFDGRPTLLVLDEAWLFLDHPLFSQRIREWLKVLRKRNVAVVFATQSLADIIASPIAPAVLESCPQRIFLPNDRAAEPQSYEAYARLGLNARQIELIAQAVPKRHYYLQSARGNRLFELGLGPVAIALCGASGAQTQAQIDALLADGEPADFAARFLASCGLAWAAELAADFPQTMKE